MSTGRYFMLLCTDKIQIVEPQRDLKKIHHTQQMCCDFKLNLHKKWSQRGKGKKKEYLSSVNDL